ncbi:MAG: hypothetical protein AAF567_24410 [Actinomycetota bacterium]
MTRLRKVGIPDLLPDRPMSDGDYEEAIATAKTVLELASRGSRQHLGIVYRAVRVVALNRLGARCVQAADLATELGPHPSVWSLMRRVEEASREVTVFVLTARRGADRAVFWQCAQLDLTERILAEQTGTPS